MIAVLSDLTIVGDVVRSPARSMHATVRIRLAALPDLEFPGCLAYRPRGQPIAMGHRENQKARCWGSRQPTWCQQRNPTAAPRWP